MFAEMQGYITYMMGFYYLLRIYKKLDKSITPALTTKE